MTNIAVVADSFFKLLFSRSENGIVMKTNVPFVVMKILSIAKYPSHFVAAIFKLKLLRMLIPRSNSDHRENAWLLNVIEL